MECQTALQRRRHGMNNGAPKLLRQRARSSDSDDVASRVVVIRALLQNWFQFASESVSAQRLATSSAKAVRWKSLKLVENLESRYLIFSTPRSDSRASRVRVWPAATSKRSSINQHSPSFIVHGSNRQRRHNIRGRNGCARLGCRPAAARAAAGSEYQRAAGSGRARIKNLISF